MVEVAHYNDDSTMVVVTRCDNDGTSYQEKAAETRCCKYLQCETMEGDSQKATKFTEQTTAPSFIDCMRLEGRKPEERKKRCPDYL